MYILEFGCGSGRLLGYLKTLKGITIHYTGVDISKKLLDISKKLVAGKAVSKHITPTFVCDDIAHYIS
ncbi:MAG: class I SAM-dependent methyltransferase [bacterium]